MLCVVRKSEVERIKLSLVEEVLKKEEEKEGRREEWSGRVKKGRQFDVCCVAKHVRREGYDNK